MRETSLVRRAALALLACMALCACIPQPSQAAKAAKDYVVEAMEEMVEESSDDVALVGLGSWMKGHSYKDPLTRSIAQGVSDHDLRVSVPFGTSDTDALRMWKDYRGKLKSKVVSKLKAAKISDDKIRLVLENINCYPPPQLHRQIGSDAQAANIFLNKWKTVPNLGTDSVATLTPAQIDEFSEGIYGEGSLTYIQEYEGQSGEVIYKNYKGKVSHSDVAYDILHDMEGREAYTAAGMINRATHRVDEVEGALKKGKAKLGKYLDRLNQDLRKGASMVGSKTDDMPPDVRRLANRLMNMTDDADAAKLLADKQNREAIERFIKDAKDRIYLMETIQKSVDKDKILMQTAQSAVENRGFRESFGKLLKSSYLQYGLRGLFLANDLKDCYQGYQENGQAGLAMALYKNANLTAAFTQAGLEAVKNGVVLAAAKVDCQDLIKGVIAAKGYQVNGDPLPMKRWAGMLPVYTDTGHDAAALVARRDEVFAKTIFPEVKAEVLKRWTKGSQPSALDKELAAAVFNHCSQSIRKGIEGWVEFETTAQKNLIRQINQTVNTLKIVPKTSPDPPRPNAQATLRMRLGKDLEAYLDGAEKELARLGAVAPKLVVTYQWKVTGPGGQALKVEGSKLFSQQTCQMDGKGQYKLTATVKVSSPTKIFGNWGEVNAQAKGEATVASGEGGLKVCVTDAVSGQPVTTAKASLTAPFTLTLSAAADANGCARLAQPKPQSYDLTVTAPGYETGRRTGLDFSQADQAPDKLSISLQPLGGGGTVQPPVAQVTVTKLVMDPPAVSLSTRGHDCLKVVAHFSDGSTKYVTDQVTWTRTASANQTIRTQTGDPSCGLLVTGLAEGLASLVAAYPVGQPDEQSVQCNIEVKDVRLEVGITPGTHYWFIGKTATWQAEVYYLENGLEGKVTSKQFAWELSGPGGKIDLGRGAKASHTWAQPGDYSLKLTGTFTIKGLAGSVSVTKTLSLGARQDDSKGGELKAGFRAPTEAPQSGQPATFKNTTTGAGTDAKAYWSVKKDFGPLQTAQAGQVDAKGNLTWTFDSEGDYEVTLKVVTADGRSDEYTLEMDVGPSDGTFKNWSGGQVNQIRAAANSGDVLLIELRKHNGVQWTQWSAASGGNLGKTISHAVDNGEYCVRGQGMRFTPGWVAYVPQGGDELRYAMFSGRGKETGRVVQMNGKGLVPDSIKLDVRKQGLHLDWYNDKPPQGGKIKREHWRAEFQCYADDPLQDINMLSSETLDAPKEDIGKLAVTTEVEKGRGGEPIRVLVKLANTSASLTYTLLVNGRASSIRPEMSGGKAAWFVLPLSALPGYPASRTSFNLEVRGKKGVSIEQKAAATLTMPGAQVQSGRFTVTPSFSPPKADFITLKLKVAGTVKGRTYGAMLDGSVLASRRADDDKLTLTIARSKLPAGAKTLALVVRESEGSGFSQKVLFDAPVNVTLPGQAASGQVAIDVVPPASAGGVIYKGDDLTFVAKCDGCDDKADYSWTICGTRYASSGPRRVQQVMYQSCEVKVEVTRRASESLGGQKINRTDTWTGATTVTTTTRPAVAAATDYPSSGLWFAVCVGSRCHREDPVRLSAPQQGQSREVALYPHLPTPGSTRPTHLDWIWETSVGGVNRTSREQTKVTAGQAKGQGLPLKVITRIPQKEGVYKLTLQPVTYWPNKEPTKWGPSCTRTITVGQAGAPQMGSWSDKPAAIAGQDSVTDQGWAQFTLPATAVVGQALPLPSVQELDARMPKGAGGAAMWYIGGKDARNVPKATAVLEQGLGGRPAQVVFNKTGTYTVKLAVIPSKKQGQVFEHEQTVKVGPKGQSGGDGQGGGAPDWRLVPDLAEFTMSPAAKAKTGQEVRLKANHPIRQTLAQHVASYQWLVDSQDAAQAAAGDPGKLTFKGDYAGESAVMVFKRPGTYHLGLKIVVSGQYAHKWMEAKKLTVAGKAKPPTGQDQETPRLSGPAQVRAGKAYTYTIDNYQAGLQYRWAWPGSAWRVLRGASQRVTFPSSLAPGKYNLGVYYHHPQTGARLIGKLEVTVVPGVAKGANRAEVVGPSKAYLGDKVTLRLKRGWSGLRTGVWKMTPSAHGQTSFKADSFTVPFKKAYKAGLKTVTVRVLDQNGMWHEYTHKVTVTTKAPPKGGNAPKPEELRVSASLRQKELPDGKLEITVSVWVKNDSGRTLKVEKATGDSWAGGRPDGQGWPAKGLRVTTLMGHRTGTVLKNVTVWNKGSHERSARFNLHTNAGVLPSPMVSFTAGSLAKIEGAVGKTGDGKADDGNTTGGGRPSCQAGLRTATSSHDMVGPSEELKADEKRDVELSLIIHGAAGKTLKSLEVRNSSGQFAVWDTTPGNGMWGLGVVRVGSTGGQRHDTSVNMPLGKDEERLLLMLCDNGSFKDGGTAYAVKARFSDGSACSCPVQRAGGGGSGDGGMMEPGGGGDKPAASEFTVTKESGATKKLDLGLAYANKTVKLSLVAATVGTWDQSGKNMDTFVVWANGKEVLKTSRKGSTKHNIQAKADARGRVTLVFQARCTGDDEGVRVGQIKVEGAVAAKPQAGSGSGVSEGAAFVGRWKGVTCCVSPRGRRKSFRFDIFRENGQLRCDDHSSNGKTWRPCVVRQGKVIACAWSLKDGRTGEYQFYFDRDDPNVLLGREPTQGHHCHEYRYELRRK